MQTITHIYTFGEELVRSIRNNTEKQNTECAGTFNLFTKGLRLVVSFKYDAGDYRITNHAEFNSALNEVSTEDLKDAHQRLLAEFQRHLTFRYAFPNAAESMVDETMYLVREILISRGITL